MVCGFINGNSSLEDKPRMQRKTELDNKPLEALVESNQRLTIGKMMINLEAFHTTIERHFAEFGKVHKCSS